ncbi:hypothetical protein BS50DRAFT_555040 [Corynespora cassiicola Philippines]|uniref:GH16 domain-containing protein n=1 Tax=Corynespora cassiicola Philippines TaxID=1448308 RepID=A0A2T2NHE6_CORCC|nr:hypothetical protein BS50DRAFT_555040 [Corynespora cassiicola Philippines]
MSYRAFFLFVLVACLSVSADTLSGQNNCSCGFLDAQTEEFFTDSIVVYFNETDSLPADFVVEDYQNKYEKDWNAIYRQGASPSNVRLDDPDSLQMIVSPSTSHHLVNGAGIRTTRRDIQHGSFRTLIKSPSRALRGSAMSMMWRYNETEATEISVMNTNDPSDAWVGTFVNGEFTTRDLGVNFTTLLEDPASNRNYTTLGGVLSNGSVDAWDYAEYRIDWNEDLINFYIGGNLTRSVLHRDNKGMPSVPSPFYFKHWSTGNRFSMEGPPGRESIANIGWIRMFFNSSSMTKEAHEDFASRCSLAEACSMDDISLRGSTTYSEQSTKKWKQKNNKDVKRMPALWISVICISFSSFLLVHALIRRAPWRKQPKPSGHGPAPAENGATEEKKDQNEKNPFEAAEYTLPSQGALVPSTVVSRAGSSDYGYSASGDDLAIERAGVSAGPSEWGGSTHGGPSHYLAGLVALCALLVTVMHFGLTFVPAMVIPGAPLHYKSEYYANLIIAPFILNQMWLGVFFTTSVRFLVAGYLKRGNMQDLAKAAVRRTPRLMIPVATIALLEYFLVDCGATGYLRYLPSLTWSTWPYVTRYETFGHYVSAILELVYLIPNAMPQITFYYCTGVLWTIAVQLQGTWLVLLGAIVVYEIKSPWKRMVYYIFCMINHWYAQSWGTYLWLGLLLTDLDVTYKYKQWLYKRPAAYYPLLIACWLCVAAGFSANVLTGFNDFNFATYENNIHPDADSGEPLWNTANAGYPAYYTPRLNGLLFAGGMQAVVELSGAVQWVLSLPPLLVLFPHIFTIYLLHGMVFWSWGSWLMVFLAERGFGYGINVTVVGITSYVILFLSLPIVTPIIEALGKDITALVWMTAIEKSPPRRKTLFPFPDDLFVRREGQNDVETAIGSSVGNSGRSTPSEKRDMKAREKVKEINQFDYDDRGGKSQLRSGWDSSI